MKRSDVTRYDSDAALIKGARRRSEHVRNVYEPKVVEESGEENKKPVKASKKVKEGAGEK